jgi:hypothetical protein
MKTNQKMTHGRRQFITGMLGAAAVTLIPNSLRSVFAAPAAKKVAAPLPPGQSPVAATDAVANAIGYKADVSEIDFKKYPNRKKPNAKNQFCDNCSLYTKVNDGWGKCSMLPNGVVAAQGWCGSWSKKA